jgi:hypothetical protein
MQIEGIPLTKINSHITNKCEYKKKLNLFFVESFHYENIRKKKIEIQIGTTG